MRHIQDSLYNIAIMNGPENLIPFIPVRTFYVKEKLKNRKEKTI